MEEVFRIDFNCYICREPNSTVVTPIKKITMIDGGVTLFYADIIYTICPKCGQKYAIPNGERSKIIHQERESKRGTG